ncbi:hypothetical protein STPYR_12746 [uncultured Stenotrophomonas sp.]|uniref:Uncharacterized protein n=1 Tax=uncultured Stenotrophomonas sp. TaxID=165438 RepID=A0A1Y5Q6F1_9GAMM|nr:hypothetical protein STPYR_12746 [uncultured Stenotrophomonas sp.]
MNELLDAKRGTMALIADGIEGWRLNRINAGPPFHVETIKYGPQYTHMRESPPQVCDARGVVALSGTGGAVFCSTREQADRLCELANAGMLDRI